MLPSSAVLWLALGMLGAAVVVFVVTLFVLLFLNIDLEPLIAKIQAARVDRDAARALVQTEHPNLARAALTIVFCLKWMVPTFVVAGILRFLGL